MGRLRYPIAGAWAIVVGLTLPALALDTPNERITLQGLTGVHVVLNETSEEAVREGLTRASLQAEMESRLRRVGLRVLTPTEALRSLGRPTLELGVHVMRSPDALNLYVYSVDLALRQQIWLMRDRSIKSFAITWSEPPAVGTVPAVRLGVVRDALSAKVEQFADAWQTANATYHLR